MDSAKKPEYLSSLLQAYHRFRVKGRELNNKLIKLLPKEAIELTGKTLGLLKDGILYFDNMDQTSVLVDQCLHTYRPGGKTIFELYLEKNPVDPHSEEYILLNASKSARYSIVRIDGMETGFGVHTTDLLWGDGAFIMDVNLSQSAKKGSLFASRIITPVPDFSTTTGAALPVFKEALNLIIEGLESRFFSKKHGSRKLSQPEIDELSAFIIRTLLSQKSSSFMEYRDIHYAPSEKAIAPLTAGRKIGRNEPCPCGSGKKYKKCCGA